MRRTLLAGAVVGLVAALGLAAPAQAHPVHHHHAAPAVVSVFHGVPDTPVDVYVNGKRLLNDFQPGTFAGPVKLKQGTYTVAITAASAKNAKDPIIGPAKFFFASKGNYTVVAHLTAAGAPTATKYRNDLRPVKHGKARLTVRHDAAAPAVDVLLNGAVAVAGLTNPHQAKAVVKARTYTARVNLAGTSTTAIGPAQLPVKAGTNTIVYAWGSATDGNLALAVQTVKLKSYCG